MMNHMPQTEKTFETGRPDDLDRSMDAALAQYSAVEPRVGLEERILANLRSGQVHTPSRAWWHWGVAAAVVAVALICITMTVRNAKTLPVITKQLPTNLQVPVQPPKRPEIKRSTAIVQPEHRPIRRPVTQAARPAVAAELRLDQFPSPQPLSTEEIALAQYVKSFPKEARLVAQAQEEFELETQKEMNNAGSETRTSDSIQLER